MKTFAQWAEDHGLSESEKSVAEAAWKACLAARQPAEQEPIGYAKPEGLISDGYGHTFTVYQSSVPLRATAPVYAAPPTQAVDLEQFRWAVEDAISAHSGFDWQIDEGKRLLALIDGNAEKSHD